MTTYEHAMLGISGTLAAGLHRRHGWPVVALGGLTAALPDWDGWSLAFGASAFARVHRTAGHNVFVCTLLAAAVAALDYRYRLIQRVGEWLGRWVRALRPHENPVKRGNPRAGELGVWVVTAVLASFSHLAADLVFSGHEKLPHWGVNLFWPFSDHAWVYPMVPWGDPGTTLIFVGGMFAMVRWPSRVQIIAATTLGLVLAYVVLRGTIAA
jgi:membrane-bound metal-dependent hydrolase YbcI (DUF457 family)